MAKMPRPRGFGELRPPIKIVTEFFGGSQDGRTSEADFQFVGDVLVVSDSANVQRVRLEYTADGLRLSVAVDDAKIPD